MGSPLLTFNGLYILSVPQWSLHPLRFLNGLYTPFGSPVIAGQKRYRGTETSSGESNPLKGRPKCGKVVSYVLMIYTPIYA